MRADQVLRIEPKGRRALEYPRHGWPQAGFKSFAYRLAHLRAPQAALVSALSVIFFLT